MTYEDNKTKRSTLRGMAGGANAGWGCAGTGGCSSDATCGFRLCLDTYQKAIYFGTQFLGLWTEYLAFNFKVGEYLK